MPALDWTVSLTELLKGCMSQGPKRCRMIVKNVLMDVMRWMLQGALVRGSQELGGKSGAVIGLKCQHYTIPNGIL